MTRRPLDPAHPVYRALVPGTLPTRKLVRRRRPDAHTPGRAMFTIESTATSFFGQASVEISPAMFAVLTVEDETTSVQARCATLGIDDPRQLAALGRELVDLWVST